MSSFPSRLVDLAVPRELFDHAGEMPPAFKMVIELPSEYFDQPAPGATPPYTSSQVDNNKLVEIQTAVMRQYNSVARRVLNSFRQDVGLSDNQVHMRTSLLGNGVGMKYASQFGNEAIAITVTAKAVRELMGGTEDLYMLVLYWNGSTTSVAAINMNDINSPVGKVKVNKKTKSVVNTGTTYDFSATMICNVGGAQFKIAKDLHVIASYVKFGSDGSMSVSSDGSEIYYYNAFNSLLNPITAFADPALLATAPKVNYSGKIVYDNSGNKIDFTLATPAASRPRSWVLYPQNVAAIGSTGGLYSYVSRFSRIDGISLNTLNHVSPYISDAQNTTWDASRFSISTFVLNGSAGPEESDTSYTAGVYSGGVGSTTADISQKVMVYSNDGNLDRITLSSFGGTTSSSVNAGLGTRSTTLTYLGLSGHQDIDLGFLPFDKSDINFDGSYVLGTTLSDILVAYYDEEDGFYSAQTTNEILSAGFLKTKLFAANGKTFLRLFFYDDITDGTKWKLYKDRTNYGPKLLSAVPEIGDLSNLITIILDIKKSDIDKLK